MRFTQEKKGFRDCPKSDVFGATIVAPYELGPFRAVKIVCTEQVFFWPLFFDVDKQFHLVLLL